jgi:enoyl-CoA hydratase/carnithine racemase
MENDMSAVLNPAETPMLLRRDEAGVAYLTLNRPAQFNALSQAMLEALIAEIDAIAGDERRARRGVVRRGQGLLCRA